jgi:hypothetical protein
MNKKRKWLNKGHHLLIYIPALEVTVLVLLLLQKNEADYITTQKKINVFNIY